MIENGFIKLQRGQRTTELLKDSAAFILLSVIALRAKRTGDFNIHKLNIGEAIIGDYCNYGLTEQKYRAAKLKLEKWGFAMFTATNRGTIARLLNSDIYDINAEQDNVPDNEQKTTNKNERILKNDKKIKYSPFVFLTDAEFWELVKKLGLEKTQEMIEKLTAYIGSSGKRYRSHYFTILNWVARDEKNVQPTQKQNIFPQKSEHAKALFTEDKTSECGCSAQSV